MGPASTPFVTTTTPSTTLTCLGMSEEASSSEIVVDENFDDVDIVRLLGLSRCKNIIKRHKRERNQRAAEDEDEE